MLTNKPKQGSCPDFPLDFRAACLIHGLSQECMLQHFIDHVLVCASFNPPEKGYDAFPVAVIYQYVNTCGRAFFTRKNSVNRWESIRSLRQIAGISRSASLDRGAKWEACTGIVESWQQAMVSLMAPSRWLLMNGNLRLRLSRDFALLCEVFQLAPEEILYYYTCQISLPWAKAQPGFNFDVTENPAMAFFVAVIKGETGIRRTDESLTHPDIQLDYLEKLQELDLRLRFNRDAVRREPVYRRLYADWYQALKSAKQPTS